MFFSYFLDRECVGDAFKVTENRRQRQGKRNREAGDENYWLIGKTDKLHHPPPFAAVLAFVAIIFN